MHKRKGCQLGVYGDKGCKKRTSTKSARTCVCAQMHGEVELPCEHLRAVYTREWARWWYRRRQLLIFPGPCRLQQKKKATQSWIWVPPSPPFKVGAKETSNFYTAIHSALSLKVCEKDLAPPPSASRQGRLVSIGINRRNPKVLTLFSVHLTHFRRRGRLSSQRQFG